MAKTLSAAGLNNYLACAHHAALWLDGVEAPEKTMPLSKSFELTASHTKPPCLRRWNRFTA